MTLKTAAHTAGGVEDAVSARLAAAALWALNGPGPLDVRTGVVYAPGNPMQVNPTSSTSPWTVTVNAGHIVTSKGNSNGVYFACNDALYTVNLSAPPASNSRIDTIYAMQQDSAAIVNPDGATAAVIGAVTGTSGNGGLGASPTAPAVPAGAIALATVQIASTATAGTSGANVTLTNLAWNWTTTRNDPIPVRTQAERDAINAYDGLQVYRLDTHLVETNLAGSWSGGSWVAYTPGLSGFTIGNGTLAGYYTLNGKMTTYEIRVTIGSTSSITGNMGVILPFTAARVNQPAGQARLTHGASVQQWGSYIYNTTGVVFPENATGGLATATVPWTWASGDTIVLVGCYERA